MVIDLVVILKNDDYQDNIGVGYLKSYLHSKGIDSIIHVLHPEAEKSLFEQLDFENRTPLIVGISVYMHIEKYAYELAREIKNHYPNIHITFGGPHVMKRAKDVLSNHLYIDSICKGEGETALYDLCKQIETQHKFNGADGFVYRNSPFEIIDCPNRTPIQELDSIPFPARDIYETKPTEYMYVMGSRGCLGHCTFCFDVNNTSFANCEPVRVRTGKNIADEIEYLSKKYNVNQFKLLDSTFEDPNEVGMKKAISFYKEIIERNLKIRFQINTRSEIAKNYTQEYLNLAKKAGLEGIYLGIESGNEEDLKLYGKIAKINDNTEAIKKIINNSINLTFGFINFNPYSTLNKLETNLEYLNLVGISYTIESLMSFLELFPNTAISKKVTRDNLLYNDYAYNENGTNFVFIDKQVETLYKNLKGIKLSYISPKIDSKVEMDMIYLKRMNLLNEKIEKIFDEIIAIKHERMDYTYLFFKQCLHYSKTDTFMLEKYIENNCFDSFDSKQKILYQKHQELFLDATKV